MRDDRDDIYEREAFVKSLGKSRRLSRKSAEKRAIKAGYTVRIVIDEGESLACHDRADFLFDKNRANLVIYRGNVLRAWLG